VRLFYIATVILRYTEQQAWRKTPYQILTLFKYHKEYNPQIFGYEKPANDENEKINYIDIALGGF
jgi:hypothetical protein